MHRLRCLRQGGLKALELLHEAGILLADSVSEQLSAAGLHESGGIFETLDLALQRRSVFRHKLQDSNSIRSEREPKL